MRRIRKVLVANRGEIARRVLATCRRRGLSTVTVFAEQERDAAHARESDESRALPGRTPEETYLSIDAILNVARETGCDAIHPGYGFLSENARFAAACEVGGFRFLGPPADVLSRAGDKIEARRVAEAARVETLPSIAGTKAELAKALRSIGTPALLKAAAGGGGRGMRRVDDSRDLARLFDEASKEAKQYFGDGRVYLERLVERARHVEVQILADSHGNVTTLGDRDCSIQRRHQKIIEESPAPGLSDDIRTRLHDAARRIATEVGYVGAGTIEFLVESDEAGSPCSFFFLEINARLQVEHPVTELVTGEDLVAWQLRIAEGEIIPPELGRRLDGHAIEARICAERPPAFLPSSGRLLAWHMPDGPGVRVDPGYEAGMLVPSEFDSLLTKVITWGPTRSAARQRLERALSETVIFGVEANTSFLVDVVRHERFAKARLDTHLLADEFGNWTDSPPAPSALAVVIDAHRKSRASHRASTRAGPWETLHGWFPRRSGEEGTALASETEALVVLDAGAAWVHFAGRTAKVTDVGRRRHGAIELDDRTSPRIVAPMPGLITSVRVDEGDQVEQGQPLLSLEAMKMSHELTARASGRVRAVRVQSGDRVELGELLVEIEES